jgi:hypothetical protein
VVSWPQIVSKTCAGVLVPSSNPLHPAKLSLLTTAVWKQAKQDDLVDLVCFLGQGDTG